MGTVLRKVYLNIPETDMKFFKEFAHKMGWSIDTKETLLSKFIESRPKNVNLSEEEIMAEVNAVRYKK